MGNSLARSGNYKPDYYSLAYYNRGLLYYTLHNYWTAIADFTQAITRHGRWGSLARNHSGLGNAYQNAQIQIKKLQQ